MLPSGKHTQNYGKSPFCMGKSTISMAIFNSFLYVYQAGYLGPQLLGDIPTFSPPQGSPGATCAEVPDCCWEGWGRWQRRDKVWHLCHGHLGSRILGGDSIWVHVWSRTMVEYMYVCIYICTVCMYVYIISRTSARDSTDSSSISTLYIATDHGKLSWNFPSVVQCCCQDHPAGRWGETKTCLKPAKTKAPF